MNQTFLLIAIKSVIGREKIAHQNAFKVIQHLLKKCTFTALLVQIDNIVQISEDPDVSSSTSDADLRLIHMQQTSAHKMTKDGLVGCLVLLGSRPFTVANVRERMSSLKQRVRISPTV